MSSTAIEQARVWHEELERYERAAARVLQAQSSAGSGPASASAARETILRQHRVKELLDVVQERASMLSKHYEDKDSARKDDVAALGTLYLFDVRVSVGAKFARCVRA